ncbi:hypothetical protein MIMGU_mgv11b024620mg [Erythranthe guttata]|uniref:Uncharacterized protein n=1 Tax=Erythranthe guttata TaxID=4155 RepID=A0A022R2X1_ERYGU|nr:hypothetical protein MIMGU_mgv11b024620mg [Erythranthe guttata]
MCIAVGLSSGCRRWPPVRRKRWRQVTVKANVEAAIDAAKKRALLFGSRLIWEARGRRRRGRDAGGGVVGEAAVVVVELVGRQPDKQKQITSIRLTLLLRPTLRRRSEFALFLRISRNSAPCACTVPLLIHNSREREL